jgi:hypothetical protein
MGSGHRSVGMCYGVEQPGQECQGQDDKTPFAPVPLKRQKNKMPHSSGSLQRSTLHASAAVNRDTRRMKAADEPGLQDSGTAASRDYYGGQDRRLPESAPAPRSKAVLDGVGY